MCGGAKTKGRVNFYRWEKTIICVATKLHTKNFGLIYYQNDFLNNKCQLMLRYQETSYIEFWFNALSKSSLSIDKCYLLLIYSPPLPFLVIYMLGVRNRSRL